MMDLSYVDVDYCKYGMPYRKRTRLWNNIFQWSPKPLCNKDCCSMNGNRHKATAQRMPIGKKRNLGDQPLFKQADLYVIAESLIYVILQSITL